MDDPVSKAVPSAVIYRATVGAIRFQSGPSPLSLGLPSMEDDAPVTMVDLKMWSVPGWDRIREATRKASRSGMRNPSGSQEPDDRDAASSPLPRGRSKGDRVSDDT